MILQSDIATRLDVKLRRELGEPILTLLADSKTEDILLNPDGRLWTKTVGNGFQLASRLSESQALSAMGTIAAIRGTVLNHDKPILETELPIDGSRFEGIVSPVTSAPTFAIRLRPRQIYSLEDYEQAGILTDCRDPRNRRRQRSMEFAESVRGLSHREIIRRAIAEKKNILLAGSTGSGKTTLLNGILAAVADLTPQDRCIVIEDTIELQTSVANCVTLHALGHVSMLDCLRATMRLKPTRIIVGEVRGGEAHTLLKSWNTGHPGGTCSIHANDAESALSRLEHLVAEATLAPQQELIAEAVDLVIFIDEDAEIAAGRKVRELLLVTGYANGRYQTEHV